MAGEISQKEKEEFYDMLSGFEGYDPGDQAFSEHLDEMTQQMNGIGGQDAMSYPSVLSGLNRAWEHHQSPVRLTGKVYVADSSIIELARESWDGPYVDHGGTFYKVTDVEFTSEGIWDRLSDAAPLIDDDGDVFRMVQFVYGFNPADLESEQPLFHALPSDVLHAEYDSPTYNAIADRLHAKWPKHMRYVDAHLDAAGDDMKKTVKALRKISKRMSELCAESEELEGWMVRYLQENIQYDRENPYLVTFQGKYCLVDHETGKQERFSVDQTVTRYLRMNSIGSRRTMSKSGKGTSVDFSIVFDEPASRFQDEGTAGSVVLYSESILGIDPTRPVSSLRDLVADDLQGGHDGHSFIDDDPEVEEDQNTHYERHPHRIEEDRLKTCLEIFRLAVDDVTTARHYRFRDENEAIHASAQIAHELRQQLAPLGLTRNDVFQVFGGMRKANFKFTSEPGTFGMSVDTEIPSGQPEPGYDIRGYYEDIMPSVDEMEDEKGDFWLVAPRLVLTTNEVQAPLATHEGVMLAQASAKASTLVNLDGTAEIQSPHLEMVQRRRAAVAKAALSGTDVRLVKSIKKLDKGFMHEHPVRTETAGRGILNAIRRTAREIAAADEVNEDALDALRQLLIKRSVFIGGEAWIDGQYHEPSNFKTAIMDVLALDLPGTGRRVVASLEVSMEDPRAANGKAVLMPLDTLARLGF